MVCDRSWVYARTALVAAVISSVVDSKYVDILGSDAGVFGYPLASVVGGMVAKTILGSAQPVYG